MMSATCFDKEHTRLPHLKEPQDGSCPLANDSVRVQQDEFLTHQVGRQHV